MADVAGLAIGAVALASLLRTCVECMGYIGDGTTYGEDFEVSVIKLLLLKTRLAAWGESVRAADEGNELPMLREHWHRNEKIVGQSLAGIQKLLCDSDSLEKKYGLRCNTATQSSSRDPSTAIRPSSGVSQIREAFRTSVEERQKQTPVLKKTSWAIRDKKKFDTLIGSLAFFIDNLENLSDRLHVLDVQRRFLDLRVQQISSADSLALLERASAQPEEPQLPTTAPAVGKEETPATHRAPGHVYIQNILQGRARAVQGDVGEVGPNARTHLYQNNQASGDARAIQGNATAPAALAFLNS
jgi:Prion-inhibition and propagation